MPGVLSSSAIAALRDLGEQLGMPDTFTLTRQTSVPDGAGGRTFTTATVASGWCSLGDAGTPAERTIADKSGFTTPKIVKFHPDVGILHTDTLIVNGTEYQVGPVPAISNDDMERVIAVEQR